MKTVSSKNLDDCIKYTYLDNLSKTEYGSFLRYLVMTMKKDMPIEFMNLKDKSVVKAQIKEFTIDYNEGIEGEKDILNFFYIPVDAKEKQKLEFVSTGKSRIIKDAKSSSKNFYRFFLYGDDEKGYRITMNRRITKK